MNSLSVPVVTVLLLSPLQDAKHHGPPLHPAYDTPIGRAPLHAPRSRVQPPLGSEAEVEQRYEHACELIDADDYDAALTEVSWLWTATDNKQSAFEPAIRSFIIESIGQLADRHEPTRLHFTTVLDGLDAFVRGDPPQSFREWTDWADLSRAMHQEDRLIRLYEERRAPDGSLEVSRLPTEEELQAMLAAGEFAFSKTIFHSYAYDDLFEVLLERGRYADAGRLHPDLVGTAEFHLTWRDEYLEENAKRYSASKLAEFQQEDREKVALLYALALAADRTSDAERVAAALLARYDDVASREALVRACGHVNVTSPAITTWLVELSAPMATRQTESTPSVGEEPEDERP